MTVDSLGQQSASAALAKLDRAASPLVWDSFEGPFGVLRTLPDETLLDNQSGPRTDRAEPTQMDWDIFLPSLDNPRTIAGDGHLFGRDMFQDSENLPRTALLLEDDTIHGDLEVLFSDDISRELVHQQTPLPIPLTPISSLVLSTSKYIPPEAPALLRHFKDNLISLSFPLKSCRKCPWQTIHLPSAMSTYAELSICQTASHTKLSLFYSLLSASSLHLFTRDQAALNLNWSGKGFKELAKRHLRLALSEEVIGVKQAKYKELLMAILSMVMLSVRLLDLQDDGHATNAKAQILSGEHAEAQAFLVDAEYLIRLRGLPKSHKSVKVRSLHHVYTYLRIMAESTCGCALLNICPDRPSSSLLAIEFSSLSLRSFRVADDGMDVDLDVTLEKSIEVGHNDIHLEVMGQWNDTLYPDIYGVPESLMTLLSQIIRLANEQELLHRGPTIDTRVVENLTRRANLLEQYVLSWKPPPPRSSSLAGCSTIEDSENDSSQAANDMILAMHQALILFYYRRIRKINAMIIQDTVRKCLGYLQQSDGARMEGGFNNTVILWPGLVAACEALDPYLQSQLLEWLLTTGHRTSLSSFFVAASIAQRVWKERQETKNYILSWFDVMKQERSPIMAT